MRNCSVVGHISSHTFFDYILELFSRQQYNEIIKVQRQIQYTKHRILGNFNAFCIEKKNYFKSI